MNNLYGVVWIIIDIVLMIMFRMRRRKKRRFSALMMTNKRLQVTIARVATTQ